MTELENHLLTALKSLSAEFNAQLKHSRQAQSELQAMFTSRNFKLPEAALGRQLDLPL
ncbi:MbeD/MobD family mobilization/exclusion protein [Serratia ureilytica]|uniref:MbeD/MobD family mobilization/exclusion protein n=1 Tax=Serratia ureilytica TaxID=300181 RepID=UPI003C7B6B7E